MAMADSTTRCGEDAKRTRRHTRILVIQGGPAMCGLLDETTFYSWKTKTGFPLIPRALTLVFVPPVGFGAHTHTHTWIH